MADIILKLGGLQAIMLGIFFFARKNNPNANFYLGMLVTLLGVASLLHSINNLYFYLQFPHFIRIGWGIPLLFGPLLYFYTLSLTQSEFRLTKKDLLHLIPYGINIFVLTPFFIKSGEEKIQILNYFTASIAAGTDQYLYYSFALRLLIGASGIFYTNQSIQVLRQFEQSLMDEYAEIEQLKLNWLKIVVYSFQVLYVIFILTLLFLVADRYASFDHELYFYLFLFFIVYLLSYKTLSEPKVVVLQNIKRDRKPIKSEVRPTSHNRPDSKLAHRLISYIEKEKPYLNGDLTAAQLAAMMGISRHQLSDVLNTELNIKFYDFINQYRVTTFKEKLSDPSNQRITLLGLALDSGFNSKASFNSTFKRLTGLTPKQFRDNLRNST